MVGRVADGVGRTRIVGHTGVYTGADALAVDAADLGVLAVWVCLAAD